MKTKMLMLSFLFLAAAPAKAELLPGTVTGFSMLNCMIQNYTSQTQMITQVQYQYTCNHGPQDPFHPYTQVMGCLGRCEVARGQTYWHNNGPWLNNCQLISATCQGWSYPAPVPLSE